MKNLLNRLLGLAGLELRRRQPPSAPPDVLDDPCLAMSQIRSGVRTAVRCDLFRCLIFNGFSLSSEGWHPFVAAAREYLEEGPREYPGSVLEKFYDEWQPANGRDALIGATLGPVVLARYPALMMHAPWLNASPDERLAGIERIIKSENRQYGGADMSEMAGYGLQGPVSREKGHLEYQRLISVLESIQKYGYDRSRGDVTVQVLKRGDEFRFRVVHGHHRMAALAALGYEAIPAIPRMVVDASEVEHWPQVYRGVWTSEEALAYFNHHFDFDSRQWAEERGLTSR